MLKITNQNKIKKIVIIGASGHAKVIIDIIEKRNEYEIFGLIDSYKTPNEKILGYSVLGNKNLIPDLMKNQGVIGGIIAIGDNWTRNKMKNHIKSIAPNFSFLPAIHPSSILCNNLKIKQGTVIMAGVVINSEATIEEFCILNTKSSLGHDSIMQNFSSIASGVTVGGNVKIGKYSAISIGTTIIQNIKIGEHSVIGAGSLVLKNIDNNVLTYGIPAKTIKTRKIGEQYLSNNLNKKIIS